MTTSRVVRDGIGQTFDARERFGRARQVTRTLEQTTAQVAVRARRGEGVEERERFVVRMTRDEVRERLVGARTRDRSRRERDEQHHAEPSRAEHARRLPRNAVVSFLRDVDSSAPARFPLGLRERCPILWRR